MTQHSLWQTLVTILANMLSKFVKSSRLKLVDENSGGSIRVTVTYPFTLDLAEESKDGNIIIHIGRKGGQHE